MYRGRSSKHDLNHDAIKDWSILQKLKKNFFHGKKDTKWQAMKNICNMYYKLLKSHVYYKI